MHIMETMKNMDMTIEEYEERRREERNRLLWERLGMESTAEEMLAALHCMEGLNVEEREIARAKTVCAA